MTTCEGCEYEEQHCIPRNCIDKSGERKNWTAPAPAPKVTAKNWSCSSCRHEAMVKCDYVEYGFIDCGGKNYEPLITAPKVMDVQTDKFSEVVNECFRLGMGTNGIQIDPEDVIAFIRTLAQRAGESAPLPDCNICGNHQTECGALLWSEPQSNGMYFKTHVCVKCYERIKAVTTRADTRPDRGMEYK